MPQDIDKTIKGISVLVNLREKYPVGFTVVIALIFFLLGNFWGRSDSRSEVTRITAQNTVLQKDQADILKASLAKNGIIAVQQEEKQELQNKNDTLTLMNDTLSTTINQVGSALLEAKNPALKILNK